MALSLTTQSAMTRQRIRLGIPIGLLTIIFAFGCRLIFEIREDMPPATIECDPLPENISVGTMLTYFGIENKTVTYDVLIPYAPRFGVYPLVTSSSQDCGVRVYYRDNQEDVQIRITVFESFVSSERAESTLFCRADDPSAEWFEFSAHCWRSVIVDERDFTFWISAQFTVEETRAIAESITISHSR